MSAIRLAILNDYEIVVVGLARLLHEFDDFEIVDISVDDTVDGSVDVVLYDTFGSADTHHVAIRSLVDDPTVGHVAVFTWNFEPTAVQRCIDDGVSGYLSKRLSAPDLADALRRIHRGEQVMSVPPDPHSSVSSERRWPGQGHDLTEREADVLALITRGLDNKSIAEMLYISPNTLKTRIRHLYRKVGADSRVQAALWGVKHGFEPDNEVHFGARP